MARKQKPIQVELHIPDNKEALDEIQRRTNDFYAHSVDVLLRKQGIIGEERKTVLKRLIEKYT